ncbi:PREDICTED: uncharacterized protein LOC109234845 [Nicotiana attenuata]|uniref:uncharacterized protein LOC109234845 n=1 Tax=Nicotiana attenuata TaxID=49451 RepID=UPI0009057339|nr:PREDICTED: uncharacterized protein LOC109234845 [Nicotiana attenuata]
MAALINYGISEKKSMVQTAIFTIELLLLSTGLISSFFMLKKAINPRYLCDMFLVNLRESLNSLKIFLSSPLYICLFINSVVILILTFSKFQHPIMEILNVFLNEKDTDDIQTQPPQQHHEKVDKPNRTNSAIAMETVMSFFSRYNSSHLSVLEDIQDEMPYNVKDIEIDSIQTAYTFPDISHLSEASEMKKPRSPHPPQITNATKTKQTNQKKFEEEEEEIEDDSLEATWKAITNKKKELNKSLTFNDALSMSRIGGLRGDISVSPEESNKKFDDFIKKINHERILQRQESDQRYMLNLAR